MKVELTVELINEPGYPTKNFYIATAYARGDVALKRVSSTLSHNHALQLLAEEIEKL